jgi:hypothetical protein
MKRKNQYKYEKLASDDLLPIKNPESDRLANNIIHSLTVILAFLLLGVFIYAIFAFASIEAGQLRKNPEQFQSPLSQPPNSSS